MNLLGNTFNTADETVQKFSTRWWAMDNGI